MEKWVSVCATVESWCRLALISCAFYVLLSHRSKHFFFLILRVSFKAEYPNKQDTKKTFSSLAFHKWDQFVSRPWMSSLRSQGVKQEAPRGRGFSSRGCSPGPAAISIHWVGAAGQHVSGVHERAGVLSKYKIKWSFQKCASLTDVYRRSYRSS